MISSPEDGDAREYSYFTRTQKYNNSCAGTLRKEDKLANYIGNPPSDNDSQVYHIHKLPAADSSPYHFYVNFTSKHLNYTLTAYIVQDSEHRIQSHSQKFLDQAHSEINRLEKIYKTSTWHKKEGALPRVFLLRENQLHLIDAAHHSEISSFPSFDWGDVSEYDKFLADVHEKVRIRLLNQVNPSAPKDIPGFREILSRLDAIIPAVEGKATMKDLIEAPNPVIDDVVHALIDMECSIRHIGKDASATRTGVIMVPLICRKAFRKRVRAARLRAIEQAKLDLKHLQEGCIKVLNHEDLDRTTPNQSRTPRIDPTSVRTMLDYVTKLFLEKLTEFQKLHSPIAPTTTL